MQAQIQVGPLLGEDDWTELAELVGADESALLQQLLRDYREAGAKAYLLERAYIDRDFSAAYSAFYSTLRSEEHTSELQSLMRTSYAVFCLKKKKNHNIYPHTLQKHQNHTIHQPIQATTESNNNNRLRR